MVLGHPHWSATSRDRAQYSGAAPSPTHTGSRHLQALLPAPQKVDPRSSAKRVSILPLYRKYWETVRVRGGVRRSESVFSEYSLSKELCIANIAFEGGFRNRIHVVGATWPWGAWRVKFGEDRWGPDTVGRNISDLGACTKFPGSRLAADRCGCSYWYVELSQFSLGGGCQVFIRFHFYLFSIFYGSDLHFQSCVA